jgi:hypothetical protein
MGKVIEALNWLLAQWFDGQETHHPLTNGRRE